MSIWASCSRISTCWIRSACGTISFFRLCSRTRATLKWPPARLAPIARQLGIEALLDKYPYEVSGGQKQRAAVARALITKPEIVLADEPTGALDSKATTKLLRMFGEINRGGQTILMVTHSTRAASHAGRVLFIKDGVVFHQLYRGNMTSNEMFAKIGDTLTMLTTGGADRG